MCKAPSVQSLEQVLSSGLGPAEAWSCSFNFHWFLCILVLQKGLLAVSEADEIAGELAEIGSLPEQLSAARTWRLSLLA